MTTSMLSLFKITKTHCGKNQSRPYDGENNLPQFHNIKQLNERLRIIHDTQNTNLDKLLREY